MSTSVLDSIDDDDEKDGDSEDNTIEFYLSENEKELTPKQKSQLANQRRVKYEVITYVLCGLGVPNNYVRTDAVRVWGNRWRVNVVVSKDGANVRAHSYFIHYQKDHIQADSHTPLVKLYDSPVEPIEPVTPTEEKETEIENHS